MNYAAFEKLCKEKGTTPTALSLKLGLKKGNTTSWKRGGNPSVEVLINLAVELNCSTDFLLGLDDVSNCKEKSPAAELTEAEQKLIDNFRQLSELEKGEIIGRTAAFAEQHVQSEPSRKGA